jgi:hypothetical protein
MIPLQPAKIRVVLVFYRTGIKNQDFLCKFIPVLNRKRSSSTLTPKKKGNKNKNNNFTSSICKPFPHQKRERTGSSRTFKPKKMNQCLISSNILIS